MTQNNNHLRRITFNETFESSLAQKSTQKFTVDKSLIKGIKENDVGKIIDQNQVRGGNENNELLDEFKEIEAVVIDTRKRYDETKTQLTRHEQQIQKLKKHKDILIGEEAKLNEIISKQRIDLQKTTQMFSQISALMESTNFRKDMYTSLKDNVKHDLLVLKKRYFDKDVKLMREGTKLRTLKTDHDSKMKLSKRCKQMLSSVEKSAYSTQMERTVKIQSFCDVLNRKQVNRQNREVREQQIMETMVSAMTDKLAEEKEWIKMFDANAFLKALLKAKMERLMAQYHKIELSFHKMKQTTSMKNSNEFIQKFLNREQTYGLLLQSISEKEKQLEQLKEEREQLEKIHHDCLYQNQEINQEQKKIEPNFSEDHTHKELHQLNEKVLENVRQNQLIYQWAIKFLSAYEGNSTRDKTLTKFPKTKKKELIIEVLTKIKTFLTELESQEAHSKKIDESFHRATPKNLFLTSDIIQRNTRIKTMSSFENYDRGFDALEDKDITHDDISEADYLQHNRRAIKKSDIYNRKFRIKSKLA